VSQTTVASVNRWIGNPRETRQVEIIVVYSTCVFHQSSLAAYGNTFFINLQLPPSSYYKNKLCTTLVGLGEEGQQRRVEEKDSMVVAVLFEQIVPSDRGLTREESIAAAVVNEDQIWQQQYHAMDATTSSSQGMTPSTRISTTLHSSPHNPIGIDPTVSRRTSMSIPLPPQQQQSQLHQQQQQLQQQQGLQQTTIVAATRQRRKRCKATKCLASLAADFDVITDWIFFFHCLHVDQAYREEYKQNHGNNGKNNADADQRPYLIPPILMSIILTVCILGTLLWLTLATDGKVASPLLRVMGYDKLSMGYVLFFCVVVEDIPQVILTFLVEDYFEEDGEFNNYALVNVIASMYDTLIKLAEAFDERADIVETGIWCKESLWAHKKKVTCVIPIPLPKEEEEDNDVVRKRGLFGSSSHFLRPASTSNMHMSRSWIHVSSIRGSVNQNLLEEAKEIVSETKLPRVRFLSASKG
jgi:hypothetical protein